MDYFVLSKTEKQQNRGKIKYLVLKAISAAFFKKATVNEEIFREIRK